LFQLVFLITNYQITHLWRPLLPALEQLGDEGPDGRVLVGCVGGRAVAVGLVVVLGTRGVVGAEG